MSYPIRLETYNGSVSIITLQTKGQVANFISTYPYKIPVGIAVKISCDLLGIRGTLIGKSGL